MNPNQNQNTQSNDNSKKMNNPGFAQKDQDRNRSAGGMNYNTDSPTGSRKQMGQESISEDEEEDAVTTQGGDLNANQRNLQGSSDDVTEQDRDQQDADKFSRRDSEKSGKSTSTLHNA